VERFLEPVFAEIPVEFEWGDVLVKFANQEDPAVVGALVALRKSPRHFVVGTEERLHVEMEVERVKKHLETLDRRLRTPSARLAGARFSGGLQSYEQVAVDSIRFEGPLEAERVTGLLETIEQPEYQAMSEELAALGVPGRAKQSVAAIEKLTQWLQRRLKQAIEVVAVPLSILTLGKLKLNELGELVRDAAYFPALTSLSAARADAIKRFRESEGISTTPEQDGDQVVVHKGKLSITMPGKFSSPDALIEAARTMLGAKPVCEDDDRFKPIVAKLPTFCLLLKLRSFFSHRSGLPCVRLPRRPDHPPPCPGARTPGRGRATKAAQRPFQERCPERDNPIPRKPPTNR
jgi:hypothetical protein